jgi:hypothetical protein
MVKIRKKLSFKVIGIDFGDGSKDSSIQRKRKK